MRKSKIRLFVEQDLAKTKCFNLDEKQTHYLFNVMKLEQGDEIVCFDNKNGEFIIEIVSISKKTCSVEIVEKTKDFVLAPDISLYFAPVKKDNTDFIIQKATELGVRRIVPTITARTITEKARKDRFIAQSIEAAEQSRRVDIPEVEDAISLEKVLSSWDKKRILFFMDETLNGQDILSVFSNKEYHHQPCAILVGPEGGFSDDELKTLRKLDFAKPVSLGKRILRAETAVIAALSCWQAILGDWK